MPRPIGARIRQAVAIVKEIGPCSYTDVWRHMEGVERGNAGKYCDRAVSHGLMSVDRSVKPMLYSVAVSVTEEPPPPAPEPIPLPRVNSVFALANQ